MKKKSFLTWFTAIIITIILLDQITKYLAQTYLDTIILLTPFLSLEYTTNTGISFGLLQSLPWLPTMIALLVIVFVPIYYQKIPKNWPVQISIALMYAGAAGNLLDRMNYGFVVDFIAFSFWPTFNIADASITIGGITLILYSYLSERKPRKKNSGIKPKKKHENRSKKR